MTQRVDLPPLLGAQLAFMAGFSGWLLCALLPLLSAPVAAWATHRRPADVLPSMKGTR